MTAFSSNSADFIFTLWFTIKLYFLLPFIPWSLWSYSSTSSVPNRLHNSLVYCQVESNKSLWFLIFPNGFHVTLQNSSFGLQGFTVLCYYLTWFKRPNILWKEGDNLDQIRNFLWQVCMTSVPLKRIKPIQKLKKCESITLHSDFILYKLTTCYPWTIQSGRCIKWSLRWNFPGAYSILFHRVTEHYKKCFSFFWSIMLENMTCRL